MSYFSIRYCLVIAVCMLGPSLCPAQEVSYISFAVPGAMGTYSMSINGSMTVAGYYNVSSTNTAGFLREADGAITTFSVQHGIQTIPESINDAGEITGFYESVPGQPHGFLREADGHIVTFDPPCSTVFNLAYCEESVPMSVNEYGVIAGDHPLAPLSSLAGFTRSRTGEFTSTTYSAEMHGFPTFFTGLNATGATVGHYTTLEIPTGVINVTSFLLHPSGYVIKFSVPLDGFPASESTAAESINDDGVIAGWYSACFYDCADTVSGGFVRSPYGEFTLFSPPGPMVTSPEAPAIFDAGIPLTAPHRLSINGPGFITGSYTDLNGTPHGFVRNPYGTITSFDPPEGFMTTATSINDSGVVAGYYGFYRNRTTAQGFLRIPKAGE